MRLAINYSEPELAAGTAVFGIGLLALPFLARLNGLVLLAGAGCGLAEGDGAFSYEAHARRNAKKLRACDLDKRDLRRRFGELDVAFLAKEIAQEDRELDSRMNEAGEEAVGSEATQIQQWRSEVNGHLALLRKRSAFSFLGLAPESSETDVQRRYKKMAFELHPDKGGDHAKFKELQTMRDRLVERKADDGEGGASAGADDDAGDPDVDSQSSDDDWDEDSDAEEKRRERRRKRKKKRDDEEEKRREEAGVFNWRRDMREALVRLWESACASQEEIAGGAFVQGNSQPALNILRAFIDRFVSSEVENTPSLGEAEAEATFNKFVRQGAEIIPVAAIVDSEATMSALAMHFNYRLLSRSNSAGVKARCAALLEAALAVPVEVRTLLQSLTARRSERKRKAQEALEEAQEAKVRAAEAEAAAAARAEGAEEDGGPEAPQEGAPKRRRIFLDWRDKLGQSEGTDPSGAAAAASSSSGSRGSGEGAAAAKGKAGKPGRPAGKGGKAAGKAKSSAAAQAAEAAAGAKRGKGRPRSEGSEKESSGPMGAKAANALNYQLKKLAKAGNGKPLEVYKAMKMDQQRRGFALRLKVDPEGSWCTVQEDTTIEATNKENSPGNAGQGERPEGGYKGPAPFKRARTEQQAAAAPPPPVAVAVPPAPRAPPAARAPAPAEPAAPAAPAPAQPLARVRAEEGPASPAAGSAGGKAHGRGGFASRAASGRGARAFVVRGSGVPQSLAPGGGEASAEAGAEAPSGELARPRSWNGKLGVKASKLAAAGGPNAAEEKAKRAEEEKMLKRTERMLERLEEREKRRQSKLKAQEKEKMDKWASKWLKSNKVNAEVE